MLTRCNGSESLKYFKTKVGQENLDLQCYNRIKGLWDCNFWHGSWNLFLLTLSFNFDEDKDHTTALFQWWHIRPEQESIQNCSLQAAISSLHEGWAWLGLGYMEPFQGETSQSKWVHAKHSAAAGISAAVMDEYF